MENEQNTWEMQKLYSQRYFKSPIVRYIVPELHKMLFDFLPKDMIDEINKYLKCDRSYDICDCHIHKTIRKKRIIQRREYNKIKLKSRTTAQKRLNKKLKH